MERIIRTVKSLNYLKELNAFRNWTLMNRLSTGQVALWHTLMTINNASGWKEWFTVSNQTLQLLTGLSRTGLDKARNRLIQLGFIQYKKGRSNQAGSYQMFSVTLLAECPIVGTEEGIAENEGEAHESTQQRRSGGTLIKQKTKQKQKKNIRRHYGDDSSFLKMARYLLRQIRAWKPDFVLRGDLQPWADECRKLVELDKRGKVAIKQVIDWATHDAFWQSNILSARKLREKFDTLQAQMQKQHQEKTSDPQKEKHPQGLDMQIAMNRWISAGYDPADQESFIAWMERGGNAHELRVTAAD